MLFLTVVLEALAWIVAGKFFPAAFRRYELAMKEAFHVKGRSREMLLPLPSGGVDLLFDHGAGGEGDDVLSGAFDLLARGKGDDSGLLAFDAEDSEPAKFDSGTFDQAGGDFIENRLNDLAGERQGEVEACGDSLYQVVFDHGGQ